MSFVDRIRAFIEKISEPLQKRLKIDARYLIGGSISLVMYQVLVIAGNFLTSLAFANWLEPGAYGQYRYVISFASLLLAFAPLGFGTAVVKYTAEGHETALRLGFRKNLLWSWLFVLLTLGCSGWYLLHGNTVLGYSLIAVAIAYPFTYSMTLFASYLIGRQMIRPAMLAAGTVSLLQSACLVGALLLTKDPVTLVVVNVGANLLLNSIAYFFSDRLIGIEKKAIAMRPFVQFGLHQSALGLFDTISSQLDKVLAFQMVGSAPLAMYLFAIAMPEQIRSLFKNFSSLITTRFARRDYAHLKQNMARYLAIMIACSAAASAAYVLAAPFIYEFLFSKYLVSIQYSQIFALNIFTVASILPQTALQVKGMHKEQYIHKTSSNAIQVVANVIGVMTAGLWGLIYAQIIGRVLSFAIVTVLFYRAKERSGDPEPEAALENAQPA
jgi:O-antigen/teichoic acid export membrane protein